MTVTAFLRGINVGGHHKVPMPQLKNCLESAGYENVRTLLNSGNVVFETKEKKLPGIELSLEKLFAETFGFPVPVMLRDMKDIHAIIEMDPFRNIQVHKDIRFYVSFLKLKAPVKIAVPHSSQDKSFQVLSIGNHEVYSVLDLAKTKTVKGMEELEKLFGKNITTRNWNTVMKVSQL